jgi:hypothetical protein
LTQEISPSIGLSRGRPNITARRPPASSQSECASRKGPIGGVGQAMADPCLSSFVQHAP